MYITRLIQKKNYLPTYQQKGQKKYLQKYCNLLTLSRVISVVLSSSLSAKRELKNCFSDFQTIQLIVSLFHNCIWVNVNLFT